MSMFGEYYCPKCSDDNNERKLPSWDWLLLQKVSSTMEECAKLRKTLLFIRSYCKCRKDRESFSLVHQAIDEVLGEE